MRAPEDRVAFRLIPDTAVSLATWRAMTEEDRAVFRRRLDSANWRRALAYLATINL